MPQVKVPNLPTSMPEFLHSLIINDSSISAASIARYYPENANFWMYAMIALGLAFVIFVALTIYMLCSPEKERTRSAATSGGNVLSTTTTTIAS